MSIPFRTQVNVARHEQIRLFVRCTGELQAEALWRALRRRFAWVSKLLPSFDLAFSHFFFVTTTEEALRAAWPAIEAEVARATASGGIAAASSHRSNHHLGDLAAWEWRLREAVARVHDEIPRQTEATQEVSLSWVVDQVRAGNVEEVEALLNRPLLSPASALRAQIALFSETGQYERLIALVESRRREVLALPASGLLGEQIVGAYLAFGRDNNLPDALCEAQRIAQAMLPELERLGQASGVREMLHQFLEPSISLVEDSVPTLREQLAHIVQVAPAEQVDPLEELGREHPGAVEVQLALGDAYAALERIDDALEAYANAARSGEANSLDILVRRLTLLLSVGRYCEALDLLPSGEDIAPVLEGLRGTALYWLGRHSEAREALERAWEAGERGRMLLLPIARIWASAGQEDRALHPYRLLLDNAPELLELEDLAFLVEGLYVHQPEDIDHRKIAEICDMYVRNDGPVRRPLKEVGDILKLRVDLWAGESRERWLEALADRLEWLGAHRRVDELRKEIDALRDIASHNRITRREHFELLEGLEAVALEDTAIRRVLANEYQVICTAGIDAALLRNEPIPTFVQSIQRSLHFLDRAAADLIAEYISDEREQLKRRNLPVTGEAFAPERLVSLAGHSLTIVGGHVAMRREVERELRERYGLTDYQEVPPSTEAHVDHTLVRERTAGRSLIVVISGYAGHDLTTLLRDLQRSEHVTGTVIWPKSRGKSGVVREILEAVATR